METNLAKPWYGVWNSDRLDRVITNEAGATIALVPVLFGDDDAEHTEKIITAAVNRQDDLVDSLHRQALQNGALSAALDRCVEALEKIAAWDFDFYGDCVADATRLARATVDAAKKGLTRINNP